MGANNEMMIPESEVNKILSDQAVKHQDELEKVETNHKLENITTAVEAVNKKVCILVDEKKEEEEKIIEAIETMGLERRQCEDRITTRMDDANEYNHKTFVKKADLRVYAFLIVAAVTGTTGFITWLGLESTNKTSDLSVDKIAEAIIKKMGK